jgi:hypothetical protein
MKKLTKKTLDELAETMTVINEDEKLQITGGYYNDCFWRCVAYMQSGGASYSEQIAESYAQSFFSSQWGAYTECYLMSFGSGMTTSQIRSYITSLVQSGNYSTSSLGFIARFNTNNISCYESTNTMHAVIVTSINADGSYDIFDPQAGASSARTIPASEVQHLERAMY